MVARGGEPRARQADWREIDVDSLELLRPRLVGAEQVALEALDELGLPATAILYDLTNTFFAGSAAGVPQAKRGRSKERRSDCPLLTLGLCLDESGFVRRSEVLPGNVTEALFFKGMRGGVSNLGQGITVRKVDVDVNALAAWCAGQDRPLDRVARAAYAAEQVQKLPPGAPAR